MILGLQNEREWQAFCEQVLQQPALASDPRFDANAKRNTHRAELDAVIHAVFGQLDTAAVEQRLDEAQIANARMNDMAGCGPIRSCRRATAGAQWARRPARSPRCCRCAPQQLRLPHGSRAGSG